MPLEMKVHHFRKEKDPRNPAASIIKLIKSNPYIRISIEGKYIFVQGGVAYHADGVALDNLPEWAVSQLLALTPSAAKECGADIVLAGANVAHKMGERKVNPAGMGQKEMPKGRPTNSNL